MQKKTLEVSLKKSSEEEQLNNIDNALKSCLSILYEKLPLQLWMITKVVGDDWHVLFTNNHGTEIKENDVLCWGDSFCSKMVQGEGPQCTMNASSIEAYKNAPIMKKMPISIYVGVPLNLPDGTFFGTLCGIDSNSDIVGIDNANKAIESISNIIATILSTKTQLDLATKHKNINPALIDSLTGINNLAGFNLEVNKLLSEARDNYNIHKSKTTELKSKANYKQTNKTRDKTSISNKVNDEIAVKLKYEVYLINIKNLQKINIERGYHIGNILLSQTVKVLCEVTHDKTLVARVDGDKFNIIVKKDYAIKELESKLDEAGIPHSIIKIRDL